MPLKLTSGFEIAKFSDLNYEEMTVEIRYLGDPVAQLNKDQGNDLIAIEIPTRFSPEGKMFIFPLDQFINAICEAKELLLSLE